MPTYEYACKDCGNRSEVVQSFSDAPLTTCEACGGPLRKIYGAAGIIFKGSGYYVTDSRNKGGNGRRKDEAASEGGGDKGDKSDKSDTKGDAGSGGESSGGGEAKKSGGKSGGDGAGTPSTSSSSSDG